MLSRIVQSVIVLLISSVAIFILIRSIPGNPAVIMAGANATPQQLQATKKLLGLNESVPQQYFKWIKNVFTGNFGISITTRTPVISEISHAIIPTLWLVAGSFIIAVAMGMIFGVAAAAVRSKRIEAILGGFMSFLYGAPSFWVGLLAILLFALKFHVLPASGFVNPIDSPISGIKSILLPCLVLGLSVAGIQGRIVKASLKDVLQMEYVLVARAKGASRRRSIWIHALRNALIPIATMYGINFASLLGGSVIIESVFSWSGMGELVVQAVNNRDYPTLQAILVMFILLFIIVNLLIDLSYSIIDPRVGR